MPGRSVNLPAVTAAMVEVLKAAGVKSVSVDPADVNPPGVLVQVRELTFPDLGDCAEVGLDLVLVVPDRDHRRALSALSALLGVVLEAVDPDGPVLLRTLALPDSPTGLPALVVPVDVPTP
jgi:hypothetical protein